MNATAGGRLTSKTATDRAPVTCIGNRRLLNVWGERPSDRSGYALRVDPIGQGWPRFKARDEGVARARARVHDDVPQALRVDHEPGPFGQRKSDLGRWIGQAVGSTVHQEHVAVRVVGELEPRA